MKKLNKLAVKVLSVLLTIILLSSQSVFADWIHTSIHSYTTYTDDNAYYNKATYSQGGAFDVDSAILIFLGENAHFIENEATTSGGGAIYNYRGSVYIANIGAEFTDNTAKTNGGAIFNSGDSLGGKFRIDDYGAKFKTNQAEGKGGAIYNEMEFKIDDDVEFISNTAKSDGGAIYNQGTFTICDNAKFTENKSLNNYGGGAIYNEGTFEIQDGAEFTSNTTEGNGGAICNRTGTVEIGDNAKFTENEANVGGAICNKETFIIGEKAEFTNNCSENNKGGAIDNTGTFTIQDGATFKNNTAKTKGGAINNNGTLNLIAKTNNIEFTDNKANGVSNAIYNYGTANLWASENANIIFNDRITGGNIININSSTTTVTTKGKVVLNEDMSGYTGTVNFYGGTIELGEKGKWFGGIFLVENSATIDMANGICGEHNFNKITLNNNLKLVVDADLEKEEMDTISATKFEGAGKITVSKVKIIKDTKEKEVTITFADDKLKDKVEFSGNIETLKYKYTATYDDTTGAFTFVNEGGSGLVNMATAAGAVASSVGGYATQSVIINQAFAGIDRQMAVRNQPKISAPKTSTKQTETKSATKTTAKPAHKATNNKQPINKKGTKQNSKKENSSRIQSSKKDNSSIVQSSNPPIFHSSKLYVSAGNQIFDDSTTIERSLWLRPFALQETIKLNGVDIDNTLYGTLAGIDLPVGQDKQLSFYLGYAGSKQEFDEVKTNQTGYLVGLTGMLVKEKWYLGVTVNGIFNKVSADSEDETNDFDMNMFTIGAKAGYNIDLSDKWILEPNITVMYGIANSDSYQTSLGSIDSQSTSNILVEPQVKAKWQLTNGWQPYGLVGYSANLSGKPKVKAGGEELELDSIDGFVEYGIGVNKEFIGSVWSCYGQVTGRSGGRNGFGGNLGIKYKF